jgi:cell wall-associated NlpC family hydrolase
MAVQRVSCLKKIAGVVVCGAMMLGLVIAPASADPVYPSQNQVDQARQAAHDAKSAVGPVQARLDAAEGQLAALYQSAQYATEQYDGATVRLQQAQLAARAAALAAVAADQRLADARDALGRLVAAAYRDDNGLTSVSLMLTANGPEQFTRSVQLIQHQMYDRQAIIKAADSARLHAYTARVAAERAVADREVSQVQVETAAQRARAAVTAEQGQLVTVTARRDQLLAELAAAEKTSVQLEQQRQQGLAEEAARRAAEAAAQAAAQAAARAAAQAAARRAAEAAAQAAAQAAARTAARATAKASVNRPQSVGGATYSGSASARALSYAYSQIGKPYVWGAAGPDSFDCSGLTMRAYGSAGVTLPHFAAFQYQASHPLVYGDLRPGDLLFWASDGNDSNSIYHEAIYIGDQKMIQAPRTGLNVEISSMWMWGPVQYYARPY